MTFVRLIGLIALFWTNWIAAVLGFVLIGLINMKMGIARITVEIIVFILALVGIWFFPLIPALYAHILAICGLVLSLAEIGNVLSKKM